MAKTTKPRVSLTDEGHTILKCSGCHTPLTDIWLTNLETPLKSKIKAKCWRCDGESPMAEIEGKVYLGITDESIIIDVKYLDAQYEGGEITQQDVLIYTERGK